MVRTFYKDIERFNEMYKLPGDGSTKLHGVDMLKKFKSILMEEVKEVDEIIEEYKKHEKSLDKEKEIGILTSISDWLGDMTVYIASEAKKYGIDMSSTLKIIMESNFSKLGLDGKPIYDNRGKVLKGPNYWKPEPKIQEVLREVLKK